MTRPHLFALALVAAGAACSSPDDRAEPASPAASALEVVIDDSVPAPLTAEMGYALVGGSCLRGDPSQGEPWQIDQLADSLIVLGLEHLVELAPRDSARLAARLARTADGLPGDTTVADFRGLPVVVRDVWRLVPAEGDTTYIAIAARRLPMESSPLEEQLMLLATPAAGQGTGETLVATWFARSAGAEDSLETRDPALAFTASDGAVRLMLIREGNDGPLIEVLERVGSRWRRQWVGTLDPCD